jgi:4-hydroxy-tetrahydrodipicolinate reductase
MNILLLGHGKTGSLVSEVASERHHHVRVVRSAENPHGAALHAENLREVDVVIDFTTPTAVMDNLAGCARARKNLVVGTTGWHERTGEVRELVHSSGMGMVFAANFSVGVNLFFEIARAASAALKQQYFGQIFERHHVHKKDAPSGTAVALQRVIKDSCGQELEIVSFREGDVVGMHEIVLDSLNDNIYLCHDAKSRRGFAEGAVRAAEWIVGKKGFYDFKDVWREL